MEKKIETGKNWEISIDKDKGKDWFTLTKRMKGAGDSSVATFRFDRNQLKALHRLAKYADLTKEVPQ